jgi:hypothetical protein
MPKSLSNFQFMKNLIKLEELGLFALCMFILLSMDLKLAWWLYILLFFAPDIGMIGYLINTKVGAITYNFFHHRLVASIALFIGIWLCNDYWLIAGLILFAHAAFDRVLGYGLKYPDSFKHTSAGYI